MTGAEADARSFQLHTPEEIQRLLASRIREHRLRLGWTQSTLASRSGVSLPTVRRYERTACTSLQNLLRLCFALGRLDDFASVILPPAAGSMAELAARSTTTRKRGSR